LPRESEVRIPSAIPVKEDVMDVDSFILDWVASVIDSSDSSISDLPGIAQELAIADGGTDPVADWEFYTVMLQTWAYKRMLAVRKR